MSLPTDSNVELLLHSDIAAQWGDTVGRMSAVVFRRFMRECMVTKGGAEMQFKSEDVEALRRLIISQLIDCAKFGEAMRTDRVGLVQKATALPDRHLTVVRP